MLERFFTRRRWAKINAEARKRCQCGAPASFVASSGPAEFGLCDEHRDVPLTAVWTCRDGRWTPNVENMRWRNIGESEWHEGAPPLDDVTIRPA